MVQIVWDSKESLMLVVDGAGSWWYVICFVLTVGSLPTYRPDWCSQTSFVRID